MKKLVLLLCLIIGIGASYLFASDSLMNVRLLSDVPLKNGFGTITARPILKDKILESKILLMGEFTVEKETSNAVIEFNKIIYNEKTYNLNSAFEKKGRLKNKNVTLKKGSNLTVEGGSKSELLQIINAVEENKKNENEKDDVPVDFKMPTISGSSNNSQSRPNTNKNKSDNDKNKKDDDKNTKSTNYVKKDDDKNMAMVVHCPSNKYKDGVATYYEQLGTICSKKTSTNIKTLYNRASCLNKVDYDKKSVELGFELYANSTDGGSFLVQTCQYKKPMSLLTDRRNCGATIDYTSNLANIDKQFYYTYGNKKEDVGECTTTGETVPLQSEIGNCTATPDFKNNVALLQKQFSYTYENKKKDVGECTTTGETVPLQSEIGNCTATPDFKNNVALLQKQFSYTYENKKKDVGECTTTGETVPLQSEIGKCTVTPDFKNNVALLQKQFSYTYENKKKDVGECTTTGETVPLEYDLNSCKEDRHDFINGVSIAQGQYFYTYDNERNDVGDCVDITEHTYTHFLDATTCKYNVVDGQVFYRQRVAYMNLLNQKKYATDCEVTNSGGYNLIKEFAGYAYKDSAKQAVRKINTYFLLPGTSTKEYVDRNIETNKAYSYNETQCNLVNDDTALTTTFYNEIKFEDTDENKTVVVQECQAKTVIPYTRINGAGKETYKGSLGKRVLTLTNGRYFFSYNGTQIVDQSNGLFPINRSGSDNLTTIVQTDKCNNWYHVGGIKVTYSNSCHGVITSKKKKYRCVAPPDTKEEHLYQYDVLFEYTQKTCQKYTYFEEIGLYFVNTEYLRGDGTTYNIDGGSRFKIIR